MKRMVQQDSNLFLITVFSVIFFGLANSSVSIADERLPRCLYVSSYHSGYDWSDGVEKGIRLTLDGKCELRQVDMDTKRKRSPQDILAAVQHSISVIKSWKPDVVITSDDNAAKHLIVPHFSDSDIPFVFNGVNWTVEEYGFPFSNVTGIVEVAPIDPMLREAMKISAGRNGVYIGAQTLTEEKNYLRVSEGARKLDGQLAKVLVQNADDWKQAFLKASREADYIVMGSNSGIEGWNKAAMAAFVAENTSVISVTNHGWMMHVTALGYTKIPEEHGEWAAAAALEILGGTPPSNIPIVTNRKWDLWLNQAVANAIGAEMSSRLTRKAKRFVLADD